MYSKETWYVSSCFHPSVCLYVFKNNFQKRRPKKLISGMQAQLQSTEVKFVYEGHWVKVKVTGEKHEM